MKNVIIGILIPFVFVGMIFMFFFFSYDEHVRNGVFDFIPEPFSSNFQGIFNDENKTPNNEEDLTVRGVIEKTNRNRENHNASPLTENQALNRIAQMKLDNMFEHQYFAHVSPNGVAVSDFAKEVNYEFIRIGDNLARGDYRNDQSLVQEWMDSPSHRKNILEPKFEEIGVAVRKGVYRDREQWMAVQVFAMPFSACPPTDESLLDDINRLESEIDRLERERDTVSISIDSARRGSAEHTQLVEEYNRITTDIKDLAKDAENKVDEYNRQVQRWRDCAND